MGPIGVPELLVIFVIALIVFGPKKLPELGRSLGKSMSEFKRASYELRSTLEEEVRLEEQKEQQQKAALSATPAPAAAGAPAAAAASETPEGEGPGPAAVDTPASADATGDPEAPASAEPAFTPVAGGETVARGNVSH
jgi:TatA/E family protein of Tat protein translocase